jgi:hypothetical protein
MAFQGAIRIESLPERPSNKRQKDTEYTAIQFESLRQTSSPNTCHDFKRMERTLLGQYLLNLFTIF